MKIYTRAWMLGCVCDTMEERALEGDIHGWESGTGNNTKSDSEFVPLTAVAPDLRHLARALPQIHK